MPLISRDPLRPHGSCGHVGAGAVRSEVLTAQERETHILTGKFPRTNISRALKIFLKAPCEPKANASVGHDPKVTLTESSCDPRKPSPHPPHPPDAPRLPFPRPDPLSAAPLQASLVGRQALRGGPCSALSLWRCQGVWGSQGSALCLEIAAASGGLASSS